MLKASSRSRPEAPPALQSGIPSAVHSEVLSVIWNRGPLSRRDLTRITGLAPSSITRLTRTLEEAGLIREVSKGPSSGGRQPTLVAPHPDAGAIVAVDLSGSILRASLVDAAGEIRMDLEHPFEAKDARQLGDDIQALVARLVERSRGVVTRLLGIGVSVPGTVDTTRGLVIDSTVLRLSNFSLKDLLEPRFQLPVFVEHDTIAAALAERYFGAGREAHDLVYVTISAGIGAGILMNDQVYRGHNGAAGELGHITVERNGLVCSCGKRGCLETVAAGPAILESAQRLAQRRHDSLTVFRGVDELGRAARDGDSLAQAILAAAADYVGVGLSAFSCLLDIPLLIVGGEVVRTGEPFLKPLREALGRYQLYSNPIELVVSQLGPDAGVRGIGVVALHRLLGLA